ncbi:inositol-1 [Entamoeba marina]
MNDNKINKLGWKKQPQEFHLNNELIKITIGTEIPNTFNYLICKVINFENSEEIKYLQTHIQANPNAIIIDSIEKQQQINSRNQITSILSNYKVSIPNSIFVTNEHDLFNAITSGDIQYPFICKPNLSQGKYEAHDMKIVINSKGISQIQFPCIVQQYINHNGKIMKVSCIGSKVIMNKWQQSFCNIDINNSTQDIIEFNNENPHKELLTNNGNGIVVELNDNEVEKIANSILLAFGVNIIGFDLIRPNGNGNPIVIDVNYFPSYGKQLSVIEFVTILLNQKHVVVNN